MAEASVTAHDTEMTGDFLSTFKIGEVLKNRDKVNVIFPMIATEVHPMKAMKVMKKKKARLQWRSITSRVRI